MGVPFWQAEESLEKAAVELFGTDPGIRSVGITRHGSGFGYRAVRNGAVALPSRSGLPRIPEIDQVPVVFADAPGEIESLVMVVKSGPASPAASSLVPEVHRHRPLVAGLQIQNFDDDDRQGILGRGLMTVGTLGCFVRDASGAPALLSNNHVIAGENRGLRRHDRILQSGGEEYRMEERIAVLTDFLDLQVSPAGGTPRLGTAVLNEVDAGLAALDPDVLFTLGYLERRNLTAPNGTAAARPGDQVFKVGRTTGLTFGEVLDVAAIVGAVAYGPGPCWFQHSIVIEGLGGTQFSDKGDSGSVVSRINGEIVGLIYAGNGQQTYACPIEAVLRGLRCTLT
jgi:hypothetical protein